MPKPPPIREDEHFIEIDQQKGEWPFIRIQRNTDGTLLILIDHNQAGHVVGSGSGIAAIVLGKKKSAAICNFLARTEPV